MHLLQQLPEPLASLLRLSVWLLLLGLIFHPLERWRPVRTGAAAPGERAHDLFYFYLGGLLQAFALSVPVAMLASGVRLALPDAVPAALGALPLWGRLLLAFVVGEIGFYWGHRLMHMVPALWRYHAVHHSPQQLYFLVNSRSHPVDLVFSRLCGMVPLYVLGLAGPSAHGTVVPLAVILLGAGWGFFVHANLRLRLGPFEWLLATPAFHHWHHTRCEHANRNFASMLPLLDKLFGTWHLPDTWPAAYGIDQPLAPTLAGQLLDPLPSASTATAENKKQ